MSEAGSGVPAPRLRYDAAPARRRWILDELDRHGFLSVTDLAAQLGVSDMTVRRDLRALATSHEIRVVHGGVSLGQSGLRGQEFQARFADQAEPKERIGAEAALRIGSDDTVALDAGTTAYAVARALSRDCRATIVTHSVPVVTALLDRPEIHVVGLGGDLLRSSQAFVGAMTVEGVHGLRVRTFFLGAAAVDARGVYVDADVERPAKRALMAIADDVVLLADSSKFSRSSPVRLCGLDEISGLITDRTPPASVRAALQQSGAELVVAT